MDIKIITGDHEKYMPLLLDADPSRELVEAYIKAGTLFAADDENGPVCECVCAPAEDEADTIELKNVATRPDMRERGLAREIIKYAVEYYKGKYANMIVGTGSNSPYHIRFYEGCGFKYYRTDYGFFTRNYPEPIIDNGLLLEDMAYLIQSLK